MVKLNKMTKGIAGTILAKVEYFNPGNSTKDRMAVKWWKMLKRQASSNRRNDH